MTKPIRVLLVEDSEADAELIAAELVAAGLAAITHRVDSRNSFEAALREFSPDVVLCDHSLSTFNARAAMESLRAIRPAVPLIVVTGNDDERHAVESLRLGAEDVVLKSHLNRLPATIVSAISTRQRLGALSPRQLEVLRLIAEGHSTPEIARRLKLSAKTIETHRTELMRRLGMHDVATLVRYAVRVGLVSTET